MEQRNNVTEFVLWGSLKVSRPENIICHVLVHLYRDHGGQPTYCPDCGGQSNPGYPYVLLLGCLSFMDAIYSTTVTPNMIIDHCMEGNHFLPGLHDPTFYRALIWWYGGFIPGGYGL